jgi:hypothetical protein
VSVTRSQVIAAAKAIAQDPATVPLLLNDSDYDLAVDQALAQFSADRPNRRVVHYTVSAPAFRFVLQGTGAILPSTGLDRWVEGGSLMLDVYHPYDTTAQAQNVPLDRNTWRVLREPTLVVLELLAITPSSGTLRLEYVTPHAVDAAQASATSIREADVKAFEILTAVKICEMAARRYVQNTGTSVFQAETVDRRSQSEVMAARAKDLLRVYHALVGKDGEVVAAGGVRKLIVPTAHRRGRLWHLE